MRADAVRAGRLQEVREAARSWKAASLIDDATLEAIDALYPDDRHRLSRGLAFLAGAATFFGGAAFVGALIGMTRPGELGVGLVLLAFSLACVAATEYQVGPLRRADAGAELATALLFGLFAASAAGVLATGHEFDWFLSTGALAFALGAYRWGFATLAALASLCTLLSLARLPVGRAWWLGACFAAIVLAWPRMRAIRIAPAHRRCLRVVFAAALVGVYLAVHYDSVRVGTIEAFGDDEWTWPVWTRAAGAILTALVPVAILAVALRARDRVALTIGALLLGASIATWRYHWDLLPMWMTLTLGGVTCFAIALGMKRFLERAPGREGRGWTADPLLDDPKSSAVLRIAALSGTLGAAPAPHADRPFQAGGGVSGGGGAQGQF